MRTKLARTLACVSISVASRAAKSGTSAARASRRSRPAPAVFASNGPGRHEPQDLREVVVELHRRTQHFGLLDRQHVQRPGLVEDARGRGVENVRQLVRVHQLQILRDEFDIDQAAGRVFEVPALAVAFLLGDGPTHFHDVAGDRFRFA